MKLRILTLLLSLVICSNMVSQNPNFHIYLCFGQSNMEGSAKIEESDKLVDPRFKMMASMDCSDSNRKLGQWYPALPPLSQCWSGLSPADYFGRNMVANLPDSVSVGVITVAIGGCDIRLFDKSNYQNYTNTYPEAWFQDKIKMYGGNPYERLVDLAKLVQKDGVIKGILLHQGETNEGDNAWPSYVKKVYNNMLADLSLDANSVPLLAGEVVHAEQGGRCSSMNAIINTLPKSVATSHVISSKGCEVSKDSVHFNSSGVRELGMRYASKMLQLSGNMLKVDARKVHPNNSLLSTEVLPDNKVAFRIFAPKAVNVNLVADGIWDKIEFKKNSLGVWEGIWSDAKVGAYHYHFVVDGVNVNDPKAPSVVENKALLMVTNGDDFFSLKEDVPHGAMSQRYYYSSTLKVTRRLHVWTPVGFEKSKKKLPVLYLIHGGGGTDMSWSTIGCIGNIFDNLMAEGKIEPMIVVMPNGTIETEKILDRVAVFKSDLMDDIIPFVEDNYLVYSDNDHRAIMGLSMGGLEALEAITNHPREFGYIGILSSGWWISDSWAQKRGTTDDKVIRLERLCKIASDFNKSVKLLQFTQGGKEDLAYDNGMETLKLFEDAGIKYEYSEMPGGHAWLVWRKNLRDIAPLLFK